MIEPVEMRRSLPMTLHGGATPLEWARKKGHEAVAADLKKAGAR